MNDKDERKMEDLTSKAKNMWNREKEWERCNRKNAEETEKEDKLESTQKEWNRIGWGI